MPSLIFGFLLFILVLIAHQGNTSASKIANKDEQWSRARYHHGDSACSTPNDAYLEIPRDSLLSHGTDVDKSSWDNSDHEATFASPLYRDTERWIALPFNAFDTKSGGGHYTYPNIRYCDRETLLDPWVHNEDEWRKREQDRRRELELGLSSHERKRLIRDQENDRTKLQAMKFLSHYDGPNGKRGIVYVTGGRDKILYHSDMPYQEAERRYAAGNVPRLSKDSTQLWTFSED